MALGDRQHVEAVAIMRSLVEQTEPVVGKIDPIKAAYVWLAENHPEPAVYIVALHQHANLDAPTPSGAPSEVTPPGSQNPPPHPTAAKNRAGSPESSHEGEPRCGRIMVGSGGDTYDPTCDLTAGHPGSCKAYSATDQHKLSRAPTEPSGDE